jgi:hypothetical protein
MHCDALAFSEQLRQVCRNHYERRRIARRAEVRNGQRQELDTMSSAASQFVIKAKFCRFIAFKKRYQDVDASRRQSCHIDFKPITSPWPRRYRQHASAS